MLEQIELYVVLFGLIVIIGQVFRKSVLPISLFLVIAGMLLSLVPEFPQIRLNPDLVLNVFLPIYVYHVSVVGSWVDIKKNLRSITLLSVGHVIFITFLIALIIHALLPQLGWPLAFVLGAVISPPDDIAIISIAEKIRMPARIVTVLKGEGMLNDATALILFRFALAAAVTHTFSIENAVFAFFGVGIGETLYGFFLGHVIGKLRLKIHNPILHIIASLLTPFLAYLPAVHFGGSGILATVVTGFVMGHHYAIRFTPEFRIIWNSIWPSLTFIIESITFLLVGLNMRTILDNISVISTSELILYSGSVILGVILGRFVWVYLAVAYLPRALFSSIRKRDPFPPWQYPFIVSWAGMRGGVSLAAALAVPVLPLTLEGANPRDLLIFLVFTVIVATYLLQGLTMPSLIKKIGLQKFSEKEEYDEHLSELRARLSMTEVVLQLLRGYVQQFKKNAVLLEEVKFYIHEYKRVKEHLQKRIEDHDTTEMHDERAEIKSELFLLHQIIEVERTEVLRLWEEEKISNSLRVKLISRLDHQVKHLPE